MRVALRIRRYDPASGDRGPQDYELDVPGHATLLDVLDVIKDRLDGTLAYRKSCGSGSCGACAMRLDGAAVLACATPAARLVDEWLAKLDQFYRRQMDAFRARVIEPEGSPAWEDAILYQAPRKGMRLNPGSVVYGRMGDEHNNPHLPARPVVDALMLRTLKRE